MVCVCGQAHDENEKEEGRYNRDRQPMLRKEGKFEGSVCIRPWKSCIFCSFWINLLILKCVRYYTRCSCLSPSLFSSFFVSSPCFPISCLIPGSLCLPKTERVESGGGKRGTRGPMHGGAEAFAGDTD